MSFDVLKFTNKLGKAGFTKEQAEALADAIKSSYKDANFATKSYVKDAERELENAIHDLKSDTDLRFVKFRNEIIEARAANDLKFEHSKHKTELIRAEFRQDSSLLRKDFSKIQWAFGVLITGMIALLVHYFFR